MEKMPEEYAKAIAAAYEQGFTDGYERSRTEVQKLAGVAETAEPEGLDMRNSEHLREARRQAGEEVLKMRANRSAPPRRIENRPVDITVSSRAFLESIGALPKSDEAGSL